MIKLLLWSKLILWSCSEYQDTPAEMDDFNSFQMTEDGKTPFILKIKSIGVPF